MHVPRLSFHKHARRYYVTIDGREHYLSAPMRRARQAPADVQERYKAAVAELLGRQTEPYHVGTDPTMSELWLGYKDYVATHYVKNGKPTAEVRTIAHACTLAVELFPDLPARLFGPTKLESVRDAMASKGLERKHLNKQLGRIRGMFRWAVRRELVQSMVWQALKSVPGIGKGKGLREERKVESVTRNQFLRTIRLFPPSLRILARVHRLIGCRIDEATIMRTCDLERHTDRESPTGELWTYTPGSSKNYASYCVGPRAQTILRWVIARTPDPAAYLFPSPRRGRPWHPSSYRQRISQAAAEAGVPHWFPLMIRHAAGQEARDRHPAGIEAAQARLRRGR